MKKLIALIVSSVMALSLVACSSQPDESTPDEGSSSSSQTVSPSESDGDASTSAGQTMGGGTVQIPNPFIDCTDIAAAEELAGFTFTLPEAYEATTIKAVEDDMIDITVLAGENEISLRKSVGTDDISGDYNQYDQTSDVVVDDMTVTTKGADDMIQVATWNNGEYCFSIVAADGLTQDEVISLVIELT